MLRAFYGLLQSSYPDLSMNRIRVLSTYLFLALLSVNSIGQINKFHDFRLQKVESVWTKFQPWIHFQLNYVNPCFWSLCPFTKSVSGGYSQEFWKNASSLRYESEMEELEELVQISQKYSRFFRGYKWFDYYYWILATGQIFDYGLQIASLNQQSLRNFTIVEIGPGYGNLASWIRTKKCRKYISVDTYEMIKMQSLFFSSSYWRRRQ